MRPRPADIETSAARAVIAAARELVRQRRWYLEMPPERPLPDPLAAALENAVAALDASQAGSGRR
jgi:hypothetical protein